MKLENELWDYALALYGRDGVEAACLSLQAAGLSINRVLFCLWLGQQAGRQLQLADLAEADNWQVQVTQALRAVRYQVRGHKQQSDDYLPCYSALRKAELACEQVELALLHDAARALSPAEPGINLALENLACYLNACTLKDDQTVRGALTTVLAACFEPLPETELLGLFRVLGTEGV